MSEEKKKDLSYRVNKIEAINKELIKRVLLVSSESKDIYQAAEERIRSHNKIITELQERIKRLEVKVGENSILSSVINFNENIGNDEIIGALKEFDKKNNEKTNDLEKRMKDNEEKLISFKKELTDLKNKSQTTTVL